jgi:hypothetical protein
MLTGFSPPLPRLPSNAILNRYYVIIAPDQRGSKDDRHGPLFFPARVFIHILKKEFSRAQLSFYENPPLLSVR